MIFIDFVLVFPRIKEYNIILIIPNMFSRRLDLVLRNEKFNIKK